MTLKKVLLLFIASISVALAIIFGNHSLHVERAYADDFSQLFGNTPGAFILYDFKKNDYIRYNEERCKQRFAPFSTFKIPISLIALETGVVKDENTTLPYDPEKHPSESWWPAEWQAPQSLRSALKHSASWYFQDIAKQFGKANYEKYIQQFQYGNENISGPIDQFWLGSPLQISPNEQVELLKRFYNNELSLSNRTTNVVKDILVLEATDSYKLSGKTGTGDLENGNTLGWLVGYLEKPDDVYFFALNLEGENFEAVNREKRMTLIKRIFGELGIIEN